MFPDHTRPFNGTLSLRHSRAHDRGARLDAWGEHLRRELWETVLGEMPEAATGVHGFSQHQPLPWDKVDLGVARTTLEKERPRASKSTLTERCHTDCGEPRGVCNRSVRAYDVQADPSVGQMEQDVRETSTETAIASPLRTPPARRNPRTI